MVLWLGAALLQLQYFALPRLEYDESDCVEVGYLLKRARGCQAVRAERAWLGLTTAFCLSLLLQGSPVPAFAQGREEAIRQMQNGLNFLKAGKSEEALKAFERAHQLDPAMLEALNNIGRIYADRGDNETAVKYFKKALNIEPLYVPALSNLGLTLYTSGKPEDAIHPWRLCLKQEKDNPTIHYYLANALRDAAEKADRETRDSFLREAREHYNTSIRLDPSNAAAFSGLGVVDLEEGRLTDARRSIMRSLQLRPQSSYSYFNLGLIEERQGNKSAAIKAFENSLKYESDEKYKGETRNRIEQLKTGRMARPGSGSGSTGASTGSIAQPDQDALNEVRARADSALKKNNYKEAAKGYEMLVAAGVSDPVLYSNFGLCLSSTGQLSKAIEAYRKAILISPSGFTEAQYNLGMALRRSGDNVSAEAAFKKAIEDARRAGKTCPAAHNMLGVILRERESLKEAAESFRLAILQSGGSLAIAHFNLALLLEKTEKSRDAVSEYRAYLKTAPNGQNARLARDRLMKLTGSPN